MKPIARLLALAALAAGLPALAPAAEPGTRHDGRWGVALVCPDTHDKNGTLVKGYDYSFEAQVSQGRFEGRYVDKRPPGASATFVGQVAADGALNIKVDGLTGSPENTVGRVRPGTPYGFTLKGMLGPASGKAERVELRPCSATFTKLS